MLLALAAGLVVGYALGGRLSRVAELRVRRARLLGSALAARVLAVLVAPLWPPLVTALVAVAVGFVAVFGWVNRRVHGVALACIGAMLDAAGRATGNRWLADWIPVAFPPRPEVVSPGEVMLAAGLGLLLVTAMTAEPAPPSERETIGAGAERSSART